MYWIIGVGGIVAGTYYFKNARAISERERSAGGALDGLYTEDNLRGAASGMILIGLGSLVYSIVRLF